MVFSFASLSGSPAGVAAWKLASEMLDDRYSCSMYPETQYYCFVPYVLNC